MSYFLFLVRSACLDIRNLTQKLAQNVPSVAKFHFSVSYRFVFSPGVMTLARKFFRLRLCLGVDAVELLRIRASQLQMLFSTPVKAWRRL